jgi:HEAT repeat protein
LWRASLARLGPADERAAGAVAGWWGKDRRLVTDALKAMGPAAEKTAIALLEREQDWGARSELCNLLAGIGTGASLPTLRDRAARDDNGNVKRSAGLAVQVIEAREAGAPWLAATLADLKSSEHGRCQQAVERLAQARPVGARRVEVARALDALLDNQHVWRESLMQAEAAWGDDQTADALATRLERQDLSDWRETLRALVVLRPDDRTAAAAARWLRNDFGFVIPLLRSLRPRSERALLAAANSGADGRTRVEACRALGEVGSPGVIPELRAMAGKAGDEQVARDAEEALKAIAARR